MAKQKRKLEQTLMEVLGFTDEDLEANRAGWMSERQREQVTAAMNQPRYRDVIVFLLGATAIGASFVLIISLIQGFVLLDASIALVVAVCATIVLLIVRRIPEKIIPDDSHIFQIEYVEGPIRLNILEEESRVSYEMLVGGLRFLLISKAVFLAFKNGYPYGIYYAPHSKTTLSAELLWEHSHMDTTKWNPE